MAIHSFVFLSLNQLWLNTTLNKMNTVLTKYGITLTGSRLTFNIKWWIS